MEIFNTFRGHLKILGIESTQSARKFPFNRNLLLGFLSFFISIILTGLFLVYFVNDIMELLQCVCTISATIELGFCFAAMVLQKWRLFNIIEFMEKLVNKRK